jgi:hypothetical protein
VKYLPPLRQTRLRTTQTQPLGLHPFSSKTSVLSLNLRFQPSITAFLFPATAPATFQGKAVEGCRNPKPRGSTDTPRKNGWTSGRDRRSLGFMKTDKPQKLGSN